MNPESNPPEDPEITEYKRRITAIRAALETETDPAILNDLKDELECQCHSAFMYQMLTEEIPADSGSSQGSFDENPPVFSKPTSPASISITKPPYQVTALDNFDWYEGAGVPTPCRDTEHALSVAGLRC